MTAAQPTSQSHIIPITRFHDVLDAGERVLLFGEGQRNTKPTILLHPAIFFSIVVVAVLVVLCFLPSTGFDPKYTTPFLCWTLAVFACPLLIYSFYCMSRIECGWYALTSKRVLFLDPLGAQVRTLASRSEVARIEGSAGLVRLFVGQEQQKTEISISQVRGLPDIVGGCDLLIPGVSAIIDARDKGGTT
jgi:hypothetical protein